MSSNILAIKNAIANLQQTWLQGNGELEPMTMNQVATLADVHVTTVSRYIDEIVLESHSGNIPAAKLFSGSTANEIRQLIAIIIGNESTKTPSTDIEIRNELALRGLSVSARTVSKYRIELGIPSSEARRKTD